MKKWLIVIFVALIVISNFVIAQEDSSQITQQNALGDVAAQIPNSGELNEALSEGVKLPAGLEVISRFVFGIKTGQDIILEEFVILVVLWFFFLILIAHIIEFVPFFSSGKIMKWSASVVIMLLVSITGALYDGSLIILNFANAFKITSRSKMLGMFFLLLIIGILGWGLIKLLNFFKKKSDVESAKRLGMNMGVKIERYAANKSGYD